MLRTRTTSSGTTQIGPFTEECWDAQNHNYYYLPAAYFESGNESITDSPRNVWISTPLGRRVRLFKPCSHIKWTADAPVERQLCRTSSTVTCLLNITRAYAACTNIYPLTVDVAHVLRNAIMNAMPPASYGHYDRWQARRPTMRTRLSLSQYLYELRSLGDLFSWIPRRHLLFKKVKLLKWRDVRDVVKAGNSAHLSYAFGWKPFVGDLIRAYEAAESYEERLYYFLHKAGRDLRAHVEADPVRLPVEVTGSSAYCNTWAETIVRGEIEYIHRSTFDYSYIVPERLLTGVRWRALLDSLGLTLTPSTVWALLPWSFVVDWFVDVGGFLESVEGDTSWLKPEVEFVQACSTIDATFSGFIGLRGKIGGEELVACSLKGTWFERDIGIPGFQFEPGELSADKIRLGASLLAGLAL